MFYTIDIQLLAKKLDAGHIPGYSLAQQFIDTVREYNLNDTQLVLLFERVSDVLDAAR